MEHQIGCTLRRAMFEKTLSDTLAGFKEEGHIGVDLMELPHEVGHVGEGQDIMAAIQGPRTYTPTNGGCEFADEAARWRWAQGGDCSRKDCPNCTPPDVTRGKGEVLGAKGEDWRAEGGKFQPGTEGYYLYPDGSPKKPPRCRAYAEYGFNSGCGCPLPLGHDGDHGGKGEVQ